MLTTKEAAAFLGVTEDIMNTWRARDIGPDFYRFERSIRYDLDDLVAYRNKCRVMPGKDELPAANQNA
jgi:hypothetical protein